MHKVSSLITRNTIIVYRVLITICDHKENMNKGDHKNSNNEDCKNANQFQKIHNYTPPSIRLTNIVNTNYQESENY